MAGAVGEERSAQSSWYVNITFPLGRVRVFDPPADLLCVCMFFLSGFCSWRSSFDCSTAAPLETSRDDASDHEMIEFGATTAEENSEDLTTMLGNMDTNDDVTAVNDIAEDLAVVDDDEDDDGGDSEEKEPADVDPLNDWETARATSFNGECQAHDVILALICATECFCF